MAIPFPDVETCIKDPAPEKILYWPGQVFDAVDVKGSADDETWLCFNSDGVSTVSRKT